MASLLDAGNLNDQANEKVIKDAGSALDVEASVIDTEGKVLYGSDGSAADSSQIQALVSGHEEFSRKRRTCFTMGFRLGAKAKKQGMCCLLPVKKARV